MSTFAHPKDFSYENGKIINVASKGVEYIEKYVDDMEM